MNQNYVVSLLAVIVLSLVAYVGVEAVGLEVLFGIVLPYAALILFVFGFIIFRVVRLSFIINPIVVTV